MPAITYCTGLPKFRLSVWQALSEEYENDPRPLEGAVWSKSQFALQNEDPGLPRLIGFALVAEDGYLTYLFVRPGWRKLGVGTELLRRATAATWLTCVPELAEYYRKCGFDVAGESHVEGMIRMHRHHS